MKYRTLIIPTLALMAFSGSSWADTEDGDAEATIRLMETAEAQSSDDIMKIIELPEHLMDAADEDQVAAVERAAKGHKTATDNVNKDLPDNANEQAQEARERSHEMSDKAKEDRENRGRSEDRPDPPGRPDNPGQP